MLFVNLICNGCFTFYVCNNIFSFKYTFNTCVYVHRGHDSFIVSKVKNKAGSKETAVHRCETFEFLTKEVSKVPNADSVGKLGVNVVW